MSIFKKIAVILAVAALIVLPTVSFAQEKSLPFKLSGDTVDMLIDQQKVTAKGNVHIGYKEIQMFCDEFIYDRTANTAELVGNVKILREGSTVNGGHAVYDFTASQAKMLDLEMDSPPMYGKAKEIIREGNKRYILKNGYVTTCNRPAPHYRLTTKEITVYPGDKVVAKNVIMRIGNIPVFFFPYYAHSLKDKAFVVQFIPGKSSKWGNYVLSRWRYYFSPQMRGKIHSDWYQKRGWGKGVTHVLESDKWGKGLFNFYSVEDTMYRRQERDDLFRMNSDRTSISPKYLEDDRYKAQASYRVSPAPRLNITSEFNKFSDEYFMKDFFHTQYEKEPHPLTYTLVDYGFNNSSLSLLAQPRMNDFYTETSYLPQLEHNIFNQPLGDTNVYLQSKTSAGNLARDFAYSNTEQDMARIYSRNILSYPMKIKWLALAPYSGVTTTYYSRDVFGEDLWRVNSENGVSLSTKIYKTLNTSFNLLGREIQSMRHVITPVVSYSLVHRPTVSNAKIYQFDSLDDSSRSQAIKFTFENKLQAKNEEKSVWDFLYFSPSAEYQLDPEGRGSRFTQVNTDAKFQPFSTLSLDTDSRYDLDLNVFQEVNAELVLSAAKSNDSIGLGHRYLRNDSSQGTLRFTKQIGPKVAFTHYNRYNYKAGAFDSHQYSVKVDLHCWWMESGIRVDRSKYWEENRDKIRKDYTLWVVFTLKDFPDLTAGFDNSYRGQEK